VVSSRVGASSFLSPQKRHEKVSVRCLRVFVHDVIEGEDVELADHPLNGWVPKLRFFLSFKKSASQVISIIINR